MNVYMYAAIYPNRKYHLLFSINQMSRVVMYIPYNHL